MSSDNRYFIGFIIIVAGFIVFIFPEIYDAIYEIMKVIIPEKADQFTTFFCMIITGGFFYFLQNWFLRRYR
ncbi:hypothetical protein [Cyanothece sp. BG0011]|uniref:hypothetical protein n=1 Tax=Cyanothece sp. BG0011 TaxID=2082950 RepID=UPI000D1DA825|nr:hypothetical protein [Cyanothece sp. BG0011]